MTNYALVSVPVMVVAFVRPLQCLHQPDIRPEFPLLNPADRVSGRDMGVMCLWGTLQHLRRREWQTEANKNRGNRRAFGSGSLDAMDVQGVRQVVVDLGWVYIYFGHSATCPILPGWLEVWQNGLYSWAGWWNIEIKVNPTQVYKHLPNRVRLNEQTLCSLCKHQHSTTASSRSAPTASVHLWMQTRRRASTSLTEEVGMGNDDWWKGPPPSHFCGECSEESATGMRGVCECGSFSLGRCIFSDDGQLPRPRVHLQL